MNLTGSGSADISLNVSATLGLDKMLQFTQENCNLMIARIQSLPLAVKKIVTAKIRDSFEAFLAANFALSGQYRTIIGNMPPTLKTEYGYTIALALESGWDLRVQFPNEPGTGADACKQTNQSISSVQVVDGIDQFHTAVTKQITWSF